jgi:hypothetical protein
MLNFADIRTGARIEGIDGPGVADIIDVNPFGADALNVVYRVNGRVAEKLIYRAMNRTWR